jgi:hypothetical protein
MLHHLVLRVNGVLAEVLDVKNRHSVEGDESQDVVADGNGVVGHRLPDLVSRERARNERNNWIPRLI